MEPHQLHRGLVIVLGTLFFAFLLTLWVLLVWPFGVYWLLFPSHQAQIRAILNGPEYGGWLTPH